MTAAAKASLTTEAQGPEQSALRTVRYQTWIDAWFEGPRDLAAAKLLLTRCIGSLAWLKTALCEPMSMALAAAYEMYPELWIDLPPSTLAERITTEPGGGGCEQILSNQIVAQRLDPGSAHTMAVLMAGVQIMDPKHYMRDLEAWLASSPPQAQVTRLLRRIADTDLSVNMLECVGRLAAYGEGRRTISGDIIAEFGHVMTHPRKAGAVPLPGGEAFVRARKVVEAASRRPAHRSRETPASLSATIRRLRSGLADGGYNADRPATQLPGRVIDAPSWIGGWAEYLANDRAFLRAIYLDTGNAKLAPASGSVTAEGKAHYTLTGGPDIRLMSGHYRLKFIGQVDAPSKIRFEVRGSIRQKGKHTLASVTRVVPASREGEIALLEFVLPETALHIHFITEVLATDGAVTLAGIEIAREKL